jgi:hypothetical protein
MGNVWETVMNSANTVCNTISFNRNNITNGVHRLNVLKWNDGHKRKVGHATPYRKWTRLKQPSWIANLLTNDTSLFFQL